MELQESDILNLSTKIGDSFQYLNSRIFWSKRKKDKDEVDSIIISIERLWAFVDEKFHNDIWISR